ncbi:MAG TPA: steroid 3-ketoacyl-CoA thiolase, partial [Ktedonobacterales bacterium]|nr:steroid 3-ketoacyl-CoA thiolase [Ktedonobacterales bacterium]
MAQTGREVVIVAATRTPIGRRNGALRGEHPVMLAAQVLRAVTRQAGIEPEMVEDVVWGCVSQVGEQGYNVARNAVLAAGFPMEVPATTVDRQCGSGQQAIHFAANLIAAGVCDI